MSIETLLFLLKLYFEQGGVIDPPKARGEGVEPPTVAEVPYQRRASVDTYPSELTLFKVDYLG